ncbi:MAG: M50 family metallopeptidase [Planctomycetes bacterium]|nr:M50 family metallopeptidase [Planctomycetota bacterium]
MFNWSLKIGRLFGIDVRIHWSLLFLIAVRIFQAAVLDTALLGIAAQQMGILFGLVLLHEFGHCFAARSVGGDADHIVLWPLGGLAYVNAPNRPWPQLWTALGGPLVNVAIALILVAVYWADSHVVRFDLLTNWWTSSFFANLFMINLALLVFNLLPAFPMDMGRVLQCLLWMRIGFYRATMIAQRVGKVFSVIMAVYGLAVNDAMLIIIGVWLFLQCEQTRMMLESGEYEEESIFAASAMMRVEEPDVVEFRRSQRGGIFSRLRRWWRGRKAGRPSPEPAEPPPKADLDPAEQARVDSLLAKISREGIGSLSGEEREFLDATSRRLRGG